MKRAAIIVAVIGGFLVPGTASAGEAADPVYWKQMGGTSLLQAGKSVMEPEQMFVVSGTCSGCGYRLVDLTWENWGSTTATGSGKVVPIGGPGTCGYPPKGCSYPDIEGTVYLSEARQTCGEWRYHAVRTLIDGKSYRYPDVDCRGMYMVPKPSLPRPTKPKLMRSGAKGIFNKIAHRGERLRYKKQSIQCSRVTRFRFRCRGRWIERLNIHGEKFTYHLKGAGWVKRDRRHFTTKVRFVVRLITPTDSFRSPPKTEWAFYVVR